MRRPWGIVLCLLLAAVAPHASGEMIVDVDSELRRLKELGKPDHPAKISPGLEEDVDSALAGRVVALHIPGAKQRIAVFEFQDPDGTGLGGAVATLVGREILLGSGARSLGVLRYRGSLQPSKQHPQGYFDKVDLVVAAQRATLAIWGMVRRDGDAVVVDVMAQLPAHAIDDAWRWQLVLPRAMGGESLGATVSPRRIQVQRVRLPVRYVPELREMADAVDVVRERPDPQARMIARLPKDSAYSVVETRGDWAKFAVNGETGWVRRAVQCRDECAPLLGTAAFVGDLLRFGEGGPAPKPSTTLARDTAIVARQLAILENLRKQVYLPASEYLERWNGDRASDFGAPYANLLALSSLARQLQAESGTPYHAIRLDDEALRPIASALAHASQDDPRNVEVLQNLAVLFRLLRDERRAGLASRLAAAAAARTETPLP